MGDVRKQPFRPAPQLVPRDLLNRTICCPSCGNESKIAWLDKLQWPNQPVAPYTGGGHFVPISFNNKCPNPECASRVQVNVPVLPVDCDWTIYGDEASRYITRPGDTPLNFFTINLVGLHRDRRARVQRRIAKLKREIRPDQDPDDWAHHASEIWSGSSISKASKIRTKKDKIDYLRRFAKALRTSRPHLVTFSFSGCIYAGTDKRERSARIQRQKEDIFCQSILFTLAEMRKRHHGVRRVFDNVKDTTIKGPRTEGWASECFRGLQYTGLFTWLMAGATTLEPSFVKPGSHFMLEIADFCSYCVARDFEKRVTGSYSEFPSSLMGIGFYQCVAGDGNSYWKWNHGIPFEYYINKKGSTG